MDQNTGNDGRERMARALVVEDHTDTLALLGKLLARIQVDAVPTTDCKSARSAVEKLGPFDIVIADQTLPDCSGTSLLAELKQASKCTTVIVSGHPRPAGALPPGVDHWIPKPVDLARLTKTVQAVLKKK